MLIEKKCDKYTRGGAIKIKLKKSFLIFRNNGTCKKYELNWKLGKFKLK